jgi:hypothetical protein
VAEYRLNRLLWSSSLIIGGSLLLLFNFGWAGTDRPTVRLIVAAALALAGLGFFSAFFAARQHWWRLIPGWTLLALAGMVAVSTLTTIAATTMGSILFVGLALAFAHVYLLRRAEHWWAILPSGFMVVLGLVLALSEQVTILTLGGILFGGVGLVFGLVYLLAGRRHWWSLIPMVILLSFGLFIFVGGTRADQSWVRWWPLLLVIAGLFLGWQATRPSAPESLKIENALPSRDRTAPPSDPAPQPPSTLGEYSQPVPGATIDVLSDPDENA